MITTYRHMTQTYINLKDEGYKAERTDRTDCNQSKHIVVTFSFVSYLQQLQRFNIAYLLRDSSTYIVPHEIPTKSNQNHDATK